MEWIKYRYQFMKKYYLDTSTLQKDIEAITPTRDAYMAEIKPKIPNDPNELPTHRIKNPDGTYSLYYGASKNYANIDIEIKDRHSLHYAANHRVFLLLKNKLTKEWEFPTHIFNEKDTIAKSRSRLFSKISGDKWSVTHVASDPIVTTKRPLTEEESSDSKFMLFNGVRAFYFVAYHKAGLPEIHNYTYEDFAWVPKLEINKYLPRDCFEVFKDALWNK